MADFSLRTRLMLLVASLIGLTALALGVWLPHTLEASATRNLKSHSSGLAQVIAGVMSVGVDFDDPEYVLEQFEHIKASPDIRYLVVIREDGSELASWNREIVPAKATWESPIQHLELHEGVLHAVTPIHSENAKATLVLGLSLDELANQRNEHITSSIQVGLGVLTIGLALSFLLGTGIIRPIEQLTIRARQVSKGEIPVASLRGSYEASWVDSVDETRRLTHAISTMGIQLGEQISATEQERRRAVAAESEAIEASRAKSAFLANMSHELRTPLNAILGYCDLLMEEMEDLSNSVSYTQDLTRIRNSGGHLLALINDILDLSKIEANKIELSSAEFELTALIDECVGTVQPLLQVRNNALRVRYHTSRPLHLETDRMRLKQVLYNLLSNAAKFTEQGDLTIQVEVEREMPVRMVRISVQDTGIGLSEEQMARVFDNFTQAEHETSATYGGTGLGLTISRKLCRLMGGDLTVSSELGSGSTFTLLVCCHLNDAEAYGLEATIPPTPVEDPVYPEQQVRP